MRNWNGETWDLFAWMAKVRPNYRAWEIGMGKRETYLHEWPRRGIQQAQRPWEATCHRHEGGPPQHRGSHSVPLSLIIQMLLFFGGGRLLDFVSFFRIQGSFFRFLRAGVFMPVQPSQNEWNELYSCQHGLCILEWIIHSMSKQTYVDMYICR